MGHERMLWGDRNIFLTQCEFLLSLCVVLSLFIKNVRFPCIKSAYKSQTIVLGLQMPWMSSTVSNYNESGINGSG